VLDFERYLGELRIQGALLRASAALAGTAAAVPSCPGWTVGDLVRHTAKVHQWATAILSGGESAAFQFSPPPDSRLFDAYDRGLAALLSRLRASAESPAAESGLPPVWTPVAAASATLFWARRQAHETAIHGVDAQLAAGYGVRDFAPEFAADGVAELLTDLAVRRFDTAAMQAGGRRPARSERVRAGRRALPLGLEPGRRRRGGAARRPEPGRPVAARLHGR